MASQLNIRDDYVSNFDITDTDSLYIIADLISYICFVQNIYTINDETTYFDKQRRIAHIKQLLI